MKVTLVEAHEILSAFDTKLRSYTEKLINQRQAMHIVKAAVSGIYIWKKFSSSGSKTLSSSTNEVISS